MTQASEPSEAIAPEPSPAPARLPVPDNLERAVLFVLVAVAVLPVINACAKYLHAYSVIQVTWARYAGHFVFMMAFFLPFGGVRLLRSKRLTLQLSRSTVHCLSALLTFYAVGFVALPTATAINFSAPLIVTALAPFVLGEKVGPARWLAVTAGFAGALLIIRPGGSAQDWAVGILLASAFASAAIQLMSRKLAQYDRAATSNTYMVLVGFVLTSAPLPFVWTNPANALDALVFVLMGVSGGIGHYFLVRAFELAPAAFVSPFTYAQILGATLIGYFVFGQLPDAWTWVGAAIIVASGIFILHRERGARSR